MAPPLFCVPHTWPGLSARDRSSGECELQQALDTDRIGGEQGIDVTIQGSVAAEQAIRGVQDTSSGIDLREQALEPLRAGELRTLPHRMETTREVTSQAGHFVTPIWQAPRRRSPHRRRRSRMSGANATLIEG